ncbi:tetratricopeptide repeat-containing sulfotransferase family protein [Thalassotalea ganghwensis]
MSKTQENALKELTTLLKSGLFAPAETQASQLLEQANLPAEEKLELLYMKAVALRYLARYQDAYQVHDQLLVLQANNGRAFQERGYCQLAEEQIDQALIAFHKAVEHNPALIASWQKIVELFHAQQHPSYAAAQQQLAQLKALPAPVLGAMDLMYEGKLHKAEHVCRTFLQKHKHQADAMCLLAEIGLQLKVFDDAEFLLESCVTLYPKNEHAKALYINVLNRLGKFKLAAKHAEEYLKTFDVNTSTATTVKATLAHCYVSLGRIDSGKAIYQTIIEEQPKRSGIYVQLGHTFKTAGEIEEATKAYQQAYQLKHDYGDAYWSLANIKTYHFSDAELTNMEKVLQQPDIAVEDSIHIAFSLGKAFEDRQDYQRAFKYYQQGNAQKKQQLNYQADKSTELINQQIRYCTPELFQQQKHAGAKAADPIFIVGLPRAGSTLLEQILASHSRIDGTMELHNILGLALKLRGRIVSGEPQYPKNLSELSEQQLRQLGEMYINDTQVYRQNAPLFIDKMPNNFIHIGLIKLILPNAKIIDARREPMACCFSGFKQLFGEGQDFSYGLTDIGRYYKDYLRLMDHWEQVLPNQILRVQHEELVNDFEAQVKRILDYCQVPFEQNCLEFYKTKRNIHTPSAEQVRQPISKKGLDQWRNFEPFLGELKQALR